MTRSRVSIRLCAPSFLLGLMVLLVLASYAPAQTTPFREIEALAASHSGSLLVVAIDDGGHGRPSKVVCFSPASQKVAWQIVPPFTVGSVAVSPDGNTVAVGLVAVTERDSGVLLLDARSGKKVGGIGDDPNSYFIPGLVFPRFGSGVSQLRYSPDGAVLYGLSNDTLFAWDVAAKKYLWTKDVPAIIEAPPDLPDPLPYGHATGFTLSPDGRQIAAVRDAVRVAAAGRTTPKHFIRRNAARGLEVDVAAFSADSRILAAGEFGTLPDGKTMVHATDFWINGALNAVHIEGCGDGIAWTNQPDVFGCQNDGGAHLRNIHDTQKDIGAAGPPSDLPLLKVGNSIWAAAYKAADWKDPSKPLPLTLVELGTGKRVTVTLPGRIGSAAAK